MNIEFMMKTIKRWINIRLKEGYKITGYGHSNGLKEIHIYFEEVNKCDIR